LWILTEDGLVAEAALLSRELWHLDSYDTENDTERLELQELK